MAGSIINLNGSSSITLTNLISILDATRVGYSAVSLTNISTTSAPLIASGSICGIGGSLYRFSSEESISTTNVTSTSNCTYYIELVASSSIVNARYSTIAPVWRSDYQGWYESTSLVYRTVAQTSFYASAYYTKTIFNNAPNLTSSIAGYALYGNSPTLGIRGNDSSFAVYGNATNYGVYGYAANNYGVYGNSNNYGVYGNAANNYGVYGNANNYGVYGNAATNYGVYGYAAGHHGVSGVASSNYGVFGNASTLNLGSTTENMYGVYGIAHIYGVYGSANNIGVYGTVIGSYPVAGNGDYYNACSKYLKYKEDVNIIESLESRPLKVYRYFWEDSNQTCFDEFISPMAEDLKYTFGLTKESDGKYTVDGIALGLGIELLEEIKKLKNRINILEGK
jgi:hypothetical protein